MQNCDYRHGRHVCRSLEDQLMEGILQIVISLKSILIFFKTLNMSFRLHTIIKSAR